MQNYCNSSWDTSKKILQFLYNCNCTDIFKFILDLFIMHLNFQLKEIMPNQNVI